MEQLISPKVNSEFREALGRSPGKSHQEYLESIITELSVDEGMIAEFLAERLNDHLEPDKDVIDDRYEMDILTGRGDFHLEPVKVGDFEFEIDVSISLTVYPDGASSIQYFELRVYEDGSLVGSNIDGEMPISFDESKFEKLLKF